MNFCTCLNIVVFVLKYTLFHSKRRHSSKRNIAICQGQLSMSSCGDLQIPLSVTKLWFRQFFYLCLQNDLDIGATDIETVRDTSSQYGHELGKLFVNSIISNKVVFFLCLHQTSWGYKFSKFGFFRVTFRRERTVT